MAVQYPSTFPNAQVRTKFPLRIVLLSLIIIPLIISLLAIAGFLLQPVQKISNLLYTNISDQQATIVWTTDKSSQGSILISSDNRLPTFSLFSKNMYKDDGEKYLSGQKTYITHSVTLSNLKPQSKYYFAIYEGFKKVYANSFLTAPTIFNLTSPNPIYGKVLLDKQTPAIGALILLQVGTATPSAKLSTLTNNEGGWSLDLANLRTADLLNAYSLKRDSIEEIIVIYKNEVVTKAHTNVGADKPWPDVILSKK